MRVLVLGAGVVGVAAAHYCHAAGHEVTVVDRREAAGLETSFANAGDVCPSYATPWAAPGMRWKAFKWMFTKDAPARLNFRLDPRLARWMLSWFLNCSAARFAVNKPRMQRIAHYSRACLEALRDETGIEYDQTTQGILQLFRTQQELEAAGQHTRILAAAGIPHRMLDAKGCVEADPGLAQAAVALAGGLHMPADETGDPCKFTQALAARLAAAGVRFEYGTQVLRLVREGDAIAGVETSRALLRADRYVVALATGSVPLLEPLGIRLPIVPVKGYSITVPIADAALAPRSGVIDEHCKVAITRMGDRLRAAGTAELGVGAADTSAPAERCRAILRAARDLYPRGAGYSAPQLWAGMRPMTPDGPPLLGPTPCSNLLLDVGHGSQGWTQACGSGRVLADLISGRQPEIDLDGLTLSRYHGARYH